jgi:hypothetical protein
MIFYTLTKFMPHAIVPAVWIPWHGNKEGFATRIRAFRPEVYIALLDEAPTF